ncbi:MAG: hypothetical protein KAS86_01105 [Candidatus Omnitrophica bacterium]|nr:hypothetical protein [Candidatus Omnitrophota bacterium]
MSRCTLARLLKGESRRLNDLAESLEDGSSLCLPAEYDGSGCLEDVISSLCRLRKEMSRKSNDRNKKMPVFEVLTEWIGKGEKR